MITVAIRTKNQASSLEFLLKNLTTRYGDDISEVIVLDNKSTDETEKIVKKYRAELVAVENFSYGGSANLVAKSAKYPIVVIFSAHSYPVSPDFFKVIRKKFEGREDLAGVRCLHSSNDYRNYILNISSKEDPNKSGLIFSGSAFYKPIWEKIPFDENVVTFEDKDWTLKVLNAGYTVEFAPVVFSYEISRTKRQEFFRFKNETAGNFNLWGKRITLKNVVNRTVMAFVKLIKNFIVDLYYILLRFLFLIKFVYNKNQ